MPLSGEAIRPPMSCVDDISVTLRRILTAVLPSLTEDERQRVSDHIKAAEPSYECGDYGCREQEVSDAAGGQPPSGDSARDSYGRGDRGGDGWA